MAHSYSLDLLMQSAEALQMEIPENRNLLARALKCSVRLEISTANMQSASPEFSRTKAAARRRRDELRASGYSVQLMEITERGGLRLAA